jgi:ribosomal protein L35
VGKKYKQKTHKATAKRFRVTGTGKVVRTKGGKSHLRRRTSKRTKAKFTRYIPSVSVRSRRTCVCIARILRRNSFFTFDIIRRGVTCDQRECKANTPAYACRSNETWQEQRVALPAAVVTRKS